jgi:hypothetical protein
MVEEQGVEPFPTGTMVKGDAIPRALKKSALFYRFTIVLLFVFVPSSLARQWTFCVLPFCLPPWFRCVKSPLFSLSLRNSLLAL